MSKIRWNPIIEKNLSVVFQVELGQTSIYLLSKLGASHSIFVAIRILGNLQATIQNITSAEKLEEDFNHNL